MRTDLSALQPVDLDRVYRPRTLSDVVGQPAAVETLQRMLKAEAVPGAILFTGPGGVGKTSLARIVAAATNCQNRDGAEPCGECSSCRRIEGGEHELVLQLNAGSDGGIDTIRATVAQCHQFVPEGQRRIIVLDEAHGLTPSAVAALLLPLEEPPERTTWILCTTDPGRLPLTIRSRCTTIPLHRIAAEEIADRVLAVAEHAGLPVSAERAAALAERADGCLRAALEQISADSDRELSGETSAAKFLLAAADRELAAGAVAARDLLTSRSESAGAALSDIASAALHVTTLLHAPGTAVGRTDAEQALLEKTARRIDSDTASRWVGRILEAVDRSRLGTLSPTVGLGLLLVQMMDKPPVVSAPASAPPAAAKPVASGEFSWEACLEAATPSLRSALQRSTLVGFDDGVLTVKTTSAARRATLSGMADAATDCLGGFGVSELKVVA